MKYDVNRWRGLAQQWKDKCYHLEQSQQEHETRKYLKLLEKHRRQSEELERTKARVWQLEKQVYGRKTEKKSVKKSEALEPASAAPKKKRGAQRGSKGHGRTPREKLPREVETLDVAPEDQVCDSCGAAYVPMSNTDNSEILEYFTKAHIREIRWKKYAKTCNCRQTPAVVTAKMAPWLEPLLDQLMQRQMEDSVFHCDETGWKVYEKMEGKIGNRWYLWVFESASSVIYRIEPTRSGDVPIKHFSSLSEKLKEVFVICDRYSGYKRLAKVNAAIILAFAGFICGGIISKLRCSTRNWSRGCSSGGSALASSITSMRVVRSISMSRGRWLSKANHSCANSSGLSARSSRWSGL